MAPDPDRTPLPHGTRPQPDTPYRHGTQPRSDALSRSVNEWCPLTGTIREGPGKIGRRKRNCPSNCLPFLMPGSLGFFLRTAAVRVLEVDDSCGCVCARPRNAIHQGLSLQGVREKPFVAPAPQAQPKTAPKRLAVWQRRPESPHGGRQPGSGPAHAGTARAANAEAPGARLRGRRRSRPGSTSPGRRTACRRDGPGPRTAPDSAGSSRSAGRPPAGSAGRRAAPAPKVTQPSWVWGTSRGR